MKVLNGEGVANHTVPESCTGTGDCTGEALTGVRAGRVLSREKEYLARAGCSERRRPETRRKATLRAPLTRGTHGLCAVVDPRHVRMHLARKPGDPTVVRGRTGARTAKGTAQRRVRR